MCLTASALGTSTSSLRRSCRSVTVSPSALTTATTGTPSATACAICEERSPPCARSALPPSRHSAPASSMRAAGPPPAETTHASSSLRGGDAGVEPTAAAASSDACSSRRVRTVRPAATRRSRSSSSYRPPRSRTRYEGVAACSCRPEGNSTPESERRGSTSSRSEGTPIATAPAHAACSESTAPRARSLSGPSCRRPRSSARSFGSDSGFQRMQANFSSSCTAAGGHHLRSRAATAGHSRRQLASLLSSSCSCARLAGSAGAPERSRNARCSAGCESESGGWVARPKATRASCATRSSSASTTVPAPLSSAAPGGETTSKSATSCVVRPAARCFGVGGGRTWATPSVKRLNVATGEWSAR
mmetsp:Transcript_7194/g.20987  ORF Transcript_7194/g.20987 Transcript_7194/m.20987 type:complete len:361 (+) Transcript_7194:287-1369(+)